MQDEITPEALKHRIDQGERVVLLDVREPFERAFCAIPVPFGFVDIHIPLQEIPTRLAEIAGQDAPIVIYCHHGVRSRSAQAWLARQGIGGLINLEGGIDAWSLRADRSVPRYM